MISQNDILSFTTIAQKIDITKGEKDFVWKFLKQIITYEDWNNLYSYLSNEKDTTGITWIQKTYQLVSQVGEAKNIFHSLFALWVLADWQKGNIHPWLVEYVIHFLENSTDKNHIKYVLELLWSNTKIRETCERRMKNEPKENKKR